MRRRHTLAGRLVHNLLVAFGSLALTAVFFFVLPFIQAITRPPEADYQLAEMDAMIDDPPPKVEEKEPEPEEEEEDKPPELSESDRPLDLSALELVLGDGTGGGWGSADLAKQLQGLGGTGDEGAALFSEADLDQRPRAIYQPSPRYTNAMRQRAPGKVWVLFIVNERGRVERPKVQKSSDPIFENAAVNAVKKWRFEPGKRKGKAVRFRLRVPITFPRSKG